MPVTLRRNAGGQATVELAMILPLLIMLLAGIYDFGCAIRADNTISNMSREGANLASRTTIAPQDIMNTLAMTAKPLDMQHRGMIYITVVQGTAGQPQIQSQTGWQNGNLSSAISSRLGTPTASAPNPTVDLGSLALGQNQTVHVVEVFYNYQSLFSVNNGMLASQFYSRSIF